ncbi:MAG: soxG [Devosia sp.]|uniref:sarcosine oxidase subunit gamma n=1 Tax=Devosia sp. TaxID=1871048 RepID=UPI002611180E|nr:sarcosine oxidase subunit gamma family protein [Devosia sp.]MDB5529937.1 soxG [Devosia sp.]
MMQTHHPLAGRALPGAQGRVSIRPVEDCTRFILRIDPQNLGAASSVWGANLPPTIGGLVSGSGRIATCIGPDEWYLIAPLTEQDAIESAFAALYATTIHSLVDVSHREVGIAVDGPDAVLALQASIAFDIAAMLVGSGCRTIIDRVQIILLREGQDSFRVEVWNSFSDHVWNLLAGICREIELGV